jgi:hypothetical protein
MQNFAVNEGEGEANTILSEDCLLTQNLKRRYFDNVVLMFQHSYAQK